MAHLVRNPDGCTHFASNPFKRERCRDCCRPWTEHQGAIAEDLLQGFLLGVKKVAGERQKAEEEAREKARAKQLAKKMRAQTVEDQWFLDGAKDDSTPAMESESDDEDTGFRMVSVDAVLSDSARQHQLSAESSRPLKVVNLIDFSECDVVAESSLPDTGDDAIVATASCSSPEGHYAAGRGQAANFFASGGLPSTPDTAQLPTLPGEPDDLLSEIQHLRQMLADANAEKSIQVAIVEDEVAEKQQLIEDLTRQRAAAEAALLEVRAEVELLSSQLAACTPGGSAEPAQDASEADHWRLEAERLRAEVVGLRASAAELTRSLVSAKSAVALAAVEAAAAKAEAEAVARRARKAEHRARTVLEGAAMQGWPAPPGTAGMPEAISFAGLSLASDASPGHAEALATAQQRGRHAAQALREIRLNADQQRTWFGKCMLDSHEADLGGQPIRCSTIGSRMFVSDS